MATINVQDVAKEVGEYIAQNGGIVSAGVYSEEIQVNAICKTITAINGKFPQFHKILGNVVQGFKAEWQALGEASLNHKLLEAYRQKVNFPIIPDEVLNTWLATLYTEGKTKEEQPISKEILEDLMAKIVDDLNQLSVTGVRDDLNADGQFGQSLDGVATQVAKALVDVDRPAFRIPLNAITSVNILDEVKSFEKQIPAKMRRKVKNIVMSDNLALMFADQYEQQYGTKVTYTEDGNMKTPLTKKNIVALDNLPDNVIFATIEDNLFRLIDVIDKPKVTDVQVLDYILKIFMDFHLGYDFAINQILFAAVFDGQERGLENAAQNALYYGAEGLAVTP